MHSAASVHAELNPNTVPRAAEAGKKKKTKLVPLKGQQTLKVPIVCIDLADE